MLGVAVPVGSTERATIGGARPTTLSVGILLTTGRDPTDGGDGEAAKRCGPAATVVGLGEAGVDTGGQDDATVDDSGERTDLDVTTGGGALNTRCGVEPGGSGVSGSSAAWIDAERSIAALPLIRLGPPLRAG